MKIKRRADGMLCDAQLRPPSLVPGQKLPSHMDPTIAATLTTATVFWYSSFEVAAMGMREKGLKTQTAKIREGNSIRPGTEQEWELVYASHEEYRQLRNAGYNFK